MRKLKRRTLSAPQLYKAAEEKGIDFVGNCSDPVFARMVREGQKANGNIIRKLIKKHCPDMYNTLALDFYNPYEHQSVRCGPYLCYCHSAIEYVFKIRINV